MTEQMFPVGGGTALAEPPAGMQAPEDEGVAGENRKKLLVVLVAVGVLVAALAGYFLMKSGGSSNSSASGLVPGAHHTVAGATTNSNNKSTTSASKPVTLPRQVAAPEGRNPFKPLYAVPVAPAAGSTSSSSTSTQSTQGNGTTGSSSSSAGTTQTAHPVWVQLKSVTGTTANFVVGYSDGQKLTATRFSNVKAPAAGKQTVFAGTFALLSVRNGVATVRFGDGSPFQLDPQHNTVVVG